MKTLKMKRLVASRTGLVIIHLSAAQYRRAERAAGSTGVRQWATGLVLAGIGASAGADVKAANTRITGTLKEVRGAIAIGQKLAKGGGR